MTQHGLTVLGFFMGLLAGAIIAFVVVLVIYCLRRRGICGMARDNKGRRKQSYNHTNASVSESVSM